VTTIELLLDAERALVAGLLDRAERTYRQVLAAEPENAIAIVGLARVALERGDEATALEMGRRALAADPENVAAGRLVARLEEVQAARTAPAEAAGQRTSAGVAASAPPPADADTPARRRGRGWLDRLLRRR